MYIVAIAWLYVLGLVSLMQPTLFRGLVTFIGAGLLPLALFLFLVGTPQRRRNQRQAAREQQTPADSSSSPPICTADASEVTRAPQTSTDTATLSPADRSR